MAAGRNHGIVRLMSTEGRQVIFESERCPAKTQVTDCAYTQFDESLCC